MILLYLTNISLHISAMNENGFFKSFLLDLFNYISWYLKTSTSKVMTLRTKKAEKQKTIYFFAVLSLLSFLENHRIPNVSLCDKKTCSIIINMNRTWPVTPAVQVVHLEHEVLLLFEVIWQVWSARSFILRHFWVETQLWCTKFGLA